MDKEIEKLAQAWDEFCDRLKAAGKVPLENQLGKTPRDQAAGFLQLARNISLGLQFKYDFNDRMFPELERYFDPTRKQGGDNSDCVYLGAQINGEETYRIYGNRGSSKYFSVVLVEEGDPWGGGTIGTIYGDQIETAADGSFELFLGPETGSGNWMKTTPKTFRVTIRQYFADWENERPMKAQIERISSPEIAKPEPLNIDRLATGLVDSARWVHESVAYWPMMLGRWQGIQNEFRSYWQIEDTNIDATPGGDPLVCYWQLPVDEALIIRVVPTECAFWNVEFGNVWWETMDYRYRLSNTNEHYAVLEEDGELIVVVAHEDPGVPNWLDCSGYSAGYITFRWMLADEHPIPQTTQVKLSDLYQNLPDEVARMGPEARERQLAQRKRGVYARFGY